MKMSYHANFIIIHSSQQVIIEEIRTEIIIESNGNKGNYLSN